MLQSAHSIAAQGILPLHEVVKLITLNPANAAGLTDRGSLEVGKVADVVLVEMAERPRVRGTLRGGRPVYWDGSIASVAAGSRQALPRTIGCVAGIS
jgi:alpha-D-ribose 1-methylphosphonate 5-triphosphate diphosphatase